MLKRKLLKKSAGLFLATILGLSVMAEHAEAKSSFIDSLLDALTKPSTTTSNRNRTSNNTDPMPKKVNLALDGTYSSVYFPNGAFKHDAVAAEHYFELDKPAEVDLHFIGHSPRLYQHYIYDNDYNKLGDRTYTNDNAKDRNIVLKPGRYLIKTEISNLSRTDCVDFEVKAVKKDIYPTVNSLGYRRHDANVLYYNTEAVDYFPYATNSEPDTKYYKFILQSPMEIKLMMDKLSKSCDLVIYLLDEDESEIDSWYGISDNHFEKVKYLNAGTYYLKIKRDSKKGAAYSIRIK